MLPGPRGTIEDESARCKDGFEDITNIFRSREGAAKSCKTCKDNTGNKGMMVKSFSTDNVP